MKKKSIQMFIVMKWQKCSHCICSHSITVWFCFRMSENYYIQVLLDACKYTVKEKEITRNITEGLENSSDEESYEMRKKILTKKILLNNLSILVVFFFWGSNFDGVFLREQFRESKFENASSEEATYIEKRKGRKMIRWPSNVDSDKE